MQGKALLAIWSDVPGDLDTDYLHWLTREHTSERLSIKGFLSVQVFRAAIPDIGRYLIVYELDNAGVLDSEDYLARLNNPTPWSARIMPRLSNFIRGGGQLVAHMGIGNGAFAAAIRFEQEVTQGQASSIADLIKCDRISGVRLMRTDAERTNVTTKEKSIRHDDRSFAALVLVEGTDEAAVSQAAGDFYSKFETAAGQPELFRLIFSLGARPPTH